MLGTCSPTVSLSGLWRCGSTYIWSKFRSATNTYCYYEPLHRGLALLTRERIARESPERTATNGHPELSRPYFAEYEPLLKGRGVPGYKASFACDRYIMRAEESHDNLYDYISELLDYACDQQRVPVLGFNRAGLRLAWLKQSFDSWTLHIDRHPFDIWSSYEERKAQGNPVFFVFWLITIERNARHPVFSPLTSSIRLRRTHQKLFSTGNRFYRHSVESLTPEIRYFLVVYLWVASALHALSHSDLVFDMDRVSVPYCADLANLVQEGCGIDVSFDDAQPRRYSREALDAVWREAVEEEVLSIFPLQAFAPYLNVNRAVMRLGELAEDKAVLLEKVLRCIASTRRLDGAA